MSLSNPILVDPRSGHFLSAADILSLADRISDLEGVYFFGFTYLTFSVRNPYIPRVSACTFHLTLYSC